MTMKVRLVRHTFIDEPDWEVVSESVPLGTEYEVLGYQRMTIINLDTKRHKVVPCYLIRGNGSEGWMPTDCLERL